MIYIPDIQLAFVGWLVARPTDAMSAVTREAKHQIRAMVANAIWDSRRPRNGNVYRLAGGGTVDLAVTIQRSGTVREYPLVGEDDWAGARLMVTTHARGTTRPSRWARYLDGCIRVATSHFQGFWSYPVDNGRTLAVEISAATITSDSELPPIASTAVAERWDYRYQTQWLVMYNQVAGTLPPIAGVGGDTLIPPPPPPQTLEGIGRDVIGSTPIR